MDTPEQVRARLKGILDLIGPGMSLTVDDRFLAAAFGSETPTVEAEQFARQNQCAFRYEPGNHHGDGAGVFGRAYAKRVGGDA